MKPKVRSKVRGVSNLKPDGIKKSGEQAFEWWGQSPEDARRLMVSKSRALVNKGVSLRAAIEKYIKDGINIGIGGFVNTRVPVAIVHEIIRNNTKIAILGYVSFEIGGPAALARQKGGRPPIAAA